MANEKRLIYADDALAAEFTIEEGGAIGYVVDSEVIRCLPTVDAVEVVRCKDCYYFTEHNDVRSGRHLGYGECHRLRGELFKDTDFCSYGERKDNG